MKHARLEYKNVCEVCGIDFHPFKREAKYCSRDCWFESRKEGLTIPCCNCGSLVYKKRKVLLKTNVLYCSRLCKDVASRYTKASDELRKLARAAVKAARKSGALVPRNCEACGNNDTDAHHYKGYEKENWLEVRWLCRSHHSSLHQSIIRGEGM